MSGRLTGRQWEILDFIKDFIKLNGFPPTLREISESFHFKSNGAARVHLKALEKKGCIRRFKNTSRGMQVLGEEDGQIFVV